jgi:NADPH-dependent 2,4-dienoyl-CoA reductase/sulfur reductase-like enzyme/nitrite reductase/ring-hydroxylating ferredoxin subunit
MTESASGKGLGRLRADLLGFYTMGSDQGKPTGPDLAQGVALAALADGVPLLGHLGDEAVMVVRRGEAVFAVAATCTHYSGPLAEGLVVGDTVRCPWHHACFNLRTGEPERAPALNPISCYAVERAGDRVKVGAKLTPAPRAPRAGAPKSIAILGAGAAGNAAAEALRRAGYDGRLTLIGREGTVPYDRPNLSKDYLAGTAPEEWIPLRSEDFYREQNIELLLGSPVEKLDAASKTLTFAGGRTLTADRILLAPGAEAVKLTVPGAELPHVRTLRTLADARAIIAAVEKKPRVVVVGASFIGMEVAAALRARKVEVHVVAPDACPFERVLGNSLGDFLRSLHVEQGVNFHLGETVSRIDAGSVTLAGGLVLPADLVVVGIGVRPALAIAEKAGLAMDRGISVDAHLETSAPGIFAAGDVARWPDPHTGQRIRVEHWVVAERMGQIAAVNLLGEKRPFDAVPFFWSTQYDVTLNYVGHAERWDRVDAEGSLEARDCRLVYRQGGNVVAVVTVGRDALSLRAELCLERNDPAALEDLLGNAP